ncbi:MAG: T9SS type A sorting domain-containing protein [Bacteroidetes bacterium]|nr:T9SS type A sorting domain-containing protein [Bacteroidota bacterium]
MKIKLLFIFYGFFCYAANAQAPIWDWAKRAGGTDVDEGLSCSTDASGNIIATGYFVSSSITFGATTLTNAGNGSDMFIVKYAPNGNVLWAKSAGGTNNDEGLSCSTDASGNIIATGYFGSSSITFGTTTLINDTTSGVPDMFIVKYDSSGNVLWAKSAGGTSDDEGLGCSTDASGNIIVTGRFLSSSMTLGTTVLTSTGNGDMFIVKYDSSGNVLWAKSGPGPDQSAGVSCSTDANGNIIATGYFFGSIITFGVITLINSNYKTDDMFIVKYDSSGNVLWAKRSGGMATEMGLSCSTDASGNIFAAGYFQSQADTFGTTILTNSGYPYKDIFLVKYDSSGNVLWAKSAAGTDDDEGLGCSTDANGNIIATGFFYSSTITFGTTTLINGTLSGYDDMFIVKYDSSGNVLWAKSAGWTGNDESYSCSIDTSGNIFATGYFQSSSLTFGTTTLTNAGNGDMFIVKLGSVAGIEENNFSNDMNIYPNPSTGIFSVSGLRSAVSSLDIYNVMGEKIYSSTVNSKLETVNLSAAPKVQASGIYFLRIGTSEGIISKKIIIARPLAKFIFKARFLFLLLL